jgi:hypothetical protein
LIRDPVKKCRHALFHLLLAQRNSKLVLLVAADVLIGYFGLIATYVWLSYLQTKHNSERYLRDYPHFWGIANMLVYHPWIREATRGLSAGPSERGMVETASVAASALFPTINFSLHSKYHTASTGGRQR